MRLAYQYRLLPTSSQQATLNRWLDMLRHQHNWMLADRFDWWEINRCAVNSCPLVCSIAEPREQPEYYGQKRSLVGLKKGRPWYKEIHSQVLQDMVKRVKLAFDRYLKGDCNASEAANQDSKVQIDIAASLILKPQLIGLTATKLKCPKLEQSRLFGIVHYQQDLR